MQNSTTELNAMNTRLTTLVGEVATEERPAVPGLPDLVADVHSMMSDQKRRNEAEGMVGQRLDGLLTMMGEERERMAGQQSSGFSLTFCSLRTPLTSAVEHVLQILEKQRQDNEVLLRAVATGQSATLYQVSKSLTDQTLRRRSVESVSASWRLCSRLRPSMSIVSRLSSDIVSARQCL